ncbi:MAG: hypothetical protein US68_C0002G0043 [Candidatus Shapirobacteria bacterium GW2011_GWE1_38_10]|uniref:Glycosyltransferase RgtA/B/C/D-like domain-containing protein n=1 Tax=Candidatus Shapirobacteria bacterium GW2011_GWE1_38_10 TaxID=1618488 RepID=A0A0G0LDP7_9BACT|nr:MAG: hypothetical protein US68_C0002G0043 [Candidatus Shapirobacteria bacterium GW2011_GWE1_38_10]
MTKEKIILIIVLLTAFLLRIYNHTYPPLLWDEAALGYNAYSILQTGRYLWSLNPLAITNRVSMFI